MQNSTTADAIPATAGSLPSRWTARIGVAIVAGILVSCFGLLIAASQAGNVAQ